MASVGPNLCLQGVDDAGVGTFTWTNPNNITLDDGSDANANFGPSVGTISDLAVTLWNGGAIGTAKSGMIWSTTGKRVDTLGSATDLWSATLTRTIVTSPNFGVAISCGFKGAQTHYVVAKNFNMAAIPSNATIVGVRVTVERDATSTKFTCDAWIDYVKMEIFYSLPGGGFFAIMSGPS